MFKGGSSSRLASGASEQRTLALQRLRALRAAGNVPAAVALARELERSLSRLPIGWGEIAEEARWYLYREIGATLLEAGDPFGALARLSTARHLAAVSHDIGAERAVLGEIALAHAHRGALGEAEQALRECSALPTTQTEGLSSGAADELAAALIIALSRLDETAPVLFDRFQAAEATPFASACVRLARVRWLVATRDLDWLERAALQLDRPSAGPASGALHDAETYGLILTQVAVGDLGRAWATIGPDPSGPLTQFAFARLALQAGFFDRAAQILRIQSPHTRLTTAQRAERTLLEYWLSVAQRKRIGPSVSERVRRMLTNPDHRCLVATIPQEIRHAAASSAAPHTAGPSNSVTGTALTTRTLTPTELQVLSALPAHRTTTALARVFGLSPNTVKSHLRSIYRKLGCSSREAAAEIATRYNLLAALQGN